MLKQLNSFSKEEIVKIAKFLELLIEIDKKEDTINKSKQERERAALGKSRKDS